MVLAPSVVQCVKQTMQISAPPSVTTNWDCHLFSVPWLTNASVASTTVINNQLVDNSANPQRQMGGIIASCTINGGSTSLLDSAPTVSSLSVPDSFFQGSARVIAAGFEVVNTTAKLNAQGQVIVYRQPQPVPKASTYTITNTGKNLHLGAGSYADVMSPPTTAAEALNLAGSRQWDAVEGNYNVITFSSLDIPADGDSWTEPMVRFAGTAQNVVQPILIPVLQRNADTGQQVTTSATAMYPMNTAGAYYTGLSPSTTLSVTFNVYIERFPSSLEKDLTVLATPAAAYDIFALQLYSHALRDMPPGVFQKDNGFGDWFAGVASKIGGAVSKIAGMIPHPVAQGISAGASTVASVADSFVAPPNSRARPLAPPQKQHVQQKHQNGAKDAEQDAKIRQLGQNIAKLQSQLMAAHNKGASKPKKRR